jgi:hemolysin activation/secretion protein
MYSFKTTGLTYSEPIGSTGLIFSLGGIVSEARPGASLKPLKLISDSESVTPKVRYALSRSRTNSLYLEGGLAFNHNITLLAGKYLTFDQTSVVDTNLIWNERDRLGFSNSNFRVSRGLPFLTTMPSNAPLASTVGFNPSFTTLSYNLQRTQFLSKQWSLNGLIAGQYTPNTLLTSEDISFGGAQIGRGYDTGQIAGDRGNGGMLELRYDSVYHSSFLKTAPQLFGFVDAAYVDTLANPVSNSIGTVKNLSSSGFGVRLNFQMKASLELLVAQANKVYPNLDIRSNPRFLLNASIQF